MTTPKLITVAEARRLARRSRQYGSMVVSAESRTYACPLDMGQHGMAHRVTVWHQPGTEPNAGKIADAFVEHYRSAYDDERCSHATAPRGA